MKRRSKGRDSIFKIIVLIVCFLAVLFIILQIKEDSPESAVHQHQSTSGFSIEQEDGFEVFSLNQLGVEFQFPREQAPLKAISQSNGAALALASKDFIIEIYDGPEFLYYPLYAAGGKESCRYDGALHNFQSATTDCNFVAYSPDSSQILTKSFRLSEGVSHVVVMPIKARSSFMVVRSDYKNDCGHALSVCEARSSQRHQKLVLFTNALIEKNHNLFAQ